MKNRKRIALALCAALVMLLGAGAVVAAEGERISQDIPSTDWPYLSSVGVEMPKEEPAVQEDTGAGEDQAVETAPDPEGTLSFANLAERVSKGSPDYRMLEENIAGVEATDYEELTDELKSQINGIADIQALLYMTGDTFSAKSMQANYDALRDALDDLQDGTMQRDAADGVRQMREAQNGIVMMAESIYAQVVELAATDAMLDRSLAALDRQLQELELRYEMGQVSALTLQQARAGRTSLVSKQQTVQMGLKSGLMGLQYMIGGGLTENLALTALPTVEETALKAMDVEVDLQKAMECSYQLYAAKKTLDQAEEDFEQAKDDYNDRDYQYTQAQHTWQAAQYTYESALLNYEMSFRTLYAQVKDYKQVLEAAKTALAVEEANYQVDQLKFSQGTISQNALLTAEDDLSGAKDTVATAERNLFVAYNNYCWAVEYGILN